MERNIQKNRAVWDTGKVDLSITRQSFSICGGSYQSQYEIREHGIYDSGAYC